MSPEMLEELLNEEEGPALDFKRDQYAFDGADKHAKSELLKDVLALANAWRRTTGYLLIGVSEVKGGRSTVVGVASHLDDAKLQQFVNRKTQRPVEFSYRPLPVEGKEIGLIQVPVQHRPVYLTKAYGKLDANTVYVRRGSSTDVAAPEEVARMGTAGVQRDDDPLPNLEIEWADLKSGRPLTKTHTVQSLLLEPRLPNSAIATTRGSLQMLNAFDNPDYARDLIVYVADSALLRPVGLRIQNKGAHVARRVRFVGTLEADTALDIRDSWHRPIRPNRHNIPTVAGIRPLGASLGSDPDPSVERYPDRWEIAVDFGDIRPRDEIWTTEPLFVGSREARSVAVDGRLLGDNIADPIQVSLALNFEVVERPMDGADIEQ